MNYLIEAFLTKDSGSKQVGCLLGDLILKKGRYVLTDAKIQRGAYVHTCIMDFTHSHPAFIRSKSRLSLYNEKHTAKFVDIFYNHFLAIHWNEYSDIQLEKFSTNLYKAFLDKIHIIPYKFKRILPVMMRSGWLMQFTSIAGLHRSMYELEKISGRSYNFEAGFRDFVNNYSGFQDDFREFFSELILYLTELQDSHADLESSSFIPPHAQCR
ncbi:MAG: acyl carrier protein phosphodiesterase [Cytophagaceae bacterium]|nr:acyl carrier protein phosphodiesterase [Cytophagaceae bacterium]